MKNLLMLVTLFGSLPLVVQSIAFAQEADFLPVATPNVRVAEITDVSVLGSSLTTSLATGGFYEDQFIEVVLGVKAQISGSCAALDSFQVLQPSTSSFDDASPDQYFRLLESWKNGCFSGGNNTPALAKLKLKFWINQRQVSRPEQPWAAPNKNLLDRLRNIVLNFDDGGWNSWRLYQFDFSDLSRPNLVFVKAYRNYQGQVVEKK